MRHDNAYVLDMLLAAREATGFAANLSFDEFERHRMAQLAILKSIEVIGEAASRVSPGCMESHPEIPWSRIVAMRNRLVHGYFNVNLERVWETVKKEIPRLIRQLEPLIPPESTESPD